MTVVQKKAIHFLTCNPMTGTSQQENNTEIIEAHHCTA